MDRHLYMRGCKATLEASLQQMWDDYITYVIAYDCD